MSIQYIFFIILSDLIDILIIVVPVLISIAYFTLVERKILGAIQRRRGPNVIGVYGLLQPLSDGFKLFVKEAVIPSNSNTFVFIVSPILLFTVSLMGWAVIPYDKYSTLTNINLGMLYFLAVSSVSVFGLTFAGWSSNSKYAFLGALRTTSQMVSYELSIGFIISTIAMFPGSYNLQKIIYFQEQVWFIFCFFPLFLMYFVCALAETSRHPFDLPEAEAELVSGYNVEYSGMKFALFSLSEYGHMLIQSCMMSILFLGGWLPPFDFLYFIPGSLWFGLKVSMFIVFFIWARAVLPRYRFDQLMDLGWKYFLPLSIGYLVLTWSVMMSFDIHPQ